MNRSRRLFIESLKMEAVTDRYSLIKRPRITSEDIEKDGYEIYYTRPHGNPYLELWYKKGKSGFHDSVLKREVPEDIVNALFVSDRRKTYWSVKYADSDFRLSRQEKDFIAKAFISFLKKKTGLDTGFEGKDIKSGTETEIMVDPLEGKKK